ncbi:MAG: AbrB/MazE/SpoVT family DNA-binding domain-containing protein [Thermoproteota archaeon]|nr:AbrB/MazE/SpoVT family DNA-binding domain-containing protein [Thermoproteota archaeon]
MTEQVEDIIKISPKGQIVIPKNVREKLGLQTGEKLLVLSRDGDILLRKTKKITIDQIAQKIAAQAENQNIDVDTLVDEATQWARQSK